MREENKRFPLVATTMAGMEEILAEELRKIGGNDVVPAKRAVTFTGDKDLIYKANLRLRTALRILKPIATFDAGTEEELYKGVKAINWAEIFDIDQTFAIHSAVFSDHFNHSQYVSLKTKDAIADRFREEKGRRPDVEKDNPDISIHVRINRKEVTISLDSSGESLHKRGYRKRLTEAPLNEVLAAGMLLHANYSGERNFVDGMCGSGTLPIEATLIANNIAPGLLHSNYSFMNWKDFDETLFDVIHEATVDKITDNPVKITGMDISFGALAIANESAQAAQIADKIEFLKNDFFKAPAPERPGLIMMNPPYDLRIKERDIADFYKRIGDKLKTDYNGYRAWVLSGNPEAMKRFGLRPFKKMHLQNGQIDCLFAGYELYEGSKKAKFNKPQSGERLR